MFSAAVLDHTLNPRNAGPLENANHFGQAGDPGGGPYALLWFEVDDRKIIRASYETYGCPAAVACASFAAEFLKGKSIEQALALDAQSIMSLLGGLPEGKGYCAVLVVHAIRRAFQEVPR